MFKSHTFSRTGHPNDHRGQFLRLNAIKTASIGGSGVPGNKKMLTLRAVRLHPYDSRDFIDSGQPGKIHHPFRSLDESALDRL